MIASSLQGPALLTEPCSNAASGRYVFDASLSSDSSMRPLTAVTWSLDAGSQQDNGAGMGALAAIIAATNARSSVK